MPKEALAAYEDAMVKEPGRYRGIAGAAKAAALMGDTVKATTYYQKLLALAGDAAGDRREVVEARRFLESK